MSRGEPVHGIRHPQVIEDARAWIRRTDAYARELERAAEHEARAPVNKRLLDDRRYLVELLDGCVWWVRMALPPLALPVDARERSIEEVALQRLGFADATSATLHEVSRRYFSRVLQACEGNQSATARVLRVSLRTVQRFVADKPANRRR